jgi:hypothetical protein
VPHLNPPSGHSVGIIEPPLLETTYQPTHRNESHMSEESEYETDLGAEYGFIRGTQWGGENTYNGAKFTCTI